MKIILTVDFANKNFNKDYQLSVSLLSKHSVLLVTNTHQLNNACQFYDILLIGQSSFDFIRKDYDIKTIQCVDNVMDTMQIIENVIGA